MTNRHFDLRILGVVLLTAAVLCGCSSRRGTQDAVAAAPFSPPALVAYHAASAVPVLQPQVLARVPHDPTAFTEGLELGHGILYEATGLVGQSQLREVDPATGAVRRAVTLPGQLFGEGIAVVRDHIWQLTWQNGVTLEWDRATLTLRRELSFTGEGSGSRQSR
jgi:glutamine cyclotransferase